MTLLTSAYTIQRPAETGQNLLAVSTRWTRDIEAPTSFEHRPLTAAPDPLLHSHATAGLHLDCSLTDTHSALAGVTTVHERATASVDDLEVRPCAKEPPVGTGHGIIPHSTAGDARSAAQAYLSFARPDRSAGLDGVGLVIDGALFQHDKPTAFPTEFEWFAVLVDRLPAVHGWTGLDAATFFVAAQPRSDIRAGRLPRLLRFNAAVPALHRTLDIAAIEAGATRFTRLANKTIVLEGPRDAERLLST